MTPLLACTYCLLRKGGIFFGEPDRSSEKFSFSAGWEPFVEMPSSRREACLVRVDEDTFLFGGGINERGQPSNEFWLVGLPKSD